MKKILVILIACLLVSCGNKKPEGKEYSPNELECFNGHIIIGATYDKSKTRICLILKDPETGASCPVEVSRKTYDMYELGDTIHYESPVSEEIKNGIDTTIKESINKVFSETSSNSKNIQLLDGITTVITQGGHEYVLTIKHSENCGCNKRE